MLGATNGGPPYSGGPSGSRKPPRSVQVAVHLGETLPADFSELATAAAAEGFGMLEVLRSEWDDSTNRFNRPGEVLLIARHRERLLGVAGLNHDPFAPEAERAGRIRRLYVHPGARGRGVGRTLIEALADAADGHFDKLTVFSPDPAGAAFYPACGFTRVEGRERRSHQRLL